MLQQLIVFTIVASAALYAAWKWAPATLRIRAVNRLAHHLGALGLSAVAGWLRQKSNNDAACGDGGCSSCGSCGSADSANVTANVNGSGDAAPQVIKLHFRQTPRA
ncbi:DUF6587 family protein [Undibacterium arcticum]|uniref:DUF6587 family protein n=1 Tax=Undibacterium arcticum TaxID=1762892 RepID=A0ABV7EXG0_9BURK